jgi:hypothetical protein
MLNLYAISQASQSHEYDLHNLFWYVPLHTELTKKLELPKNE